MGRKGAVNAVGRSYHADPPEEKRRSTTCKKGSFFLSFLFGGKMEGEYGAGVYFSTKERKREKRWWLGGCDSTRTVSRKERATPLVLLHERENSCMLKIRLQVAPDRRKNKKGEGGLANFLRKGGAGSHHTGGKASLIVAKATRGKKKERGKHRPVTICEKGKKKGSDSKCVG